MVRLAGRDSGRENSAGQQQAQLTWIGLAGWIVLKLMAKVRE